MGLKRTHKNDSMNPKRTQIKNLRKLQKKLNELKEGNKGDWFF
jgi:ribosomal protein L19E